MKLYGYWRSTCSWRVRIALHYKNVAFENVPVHLVRGGGEQNAAGFAAKNPMRQVPVLEIEPGVFLGQSMAIIDFLEARYPKPALYPGDPFGRARARQLAEIVTSGIHPLQNLEVLQHLEKVAPGADGKAWGRHFIGRGLAALEALAVMTAGQFLVGDAPSVAEVALIPQLYNGRRYECDVDAFPTLLKVETACNELDAFRAAHPDRQPDAPSAD